jgi:hypothetical protein
MQPLMPVVRRAAGNHENARSAVECGNEAAAVESLAQRR